MSKKIPALNFKNPFVSTNFQDKNVQLFFGKTRELQQPPINKITFSQWLLPRLPFSSFVGLHCQTWKKNGSYRCSLKSSNNASQNVAAREIMVPPGFTAEQESCMINSNLLQVWLSPWLNKSKTGLRKQECFPLGREMKTGILCQAVFQGGGTTLHQPESLRNPTNIVILTANITASFTDTRKKRQWSCLIFIQTKCVL